jgi:hypothetical protein
MTAMRSSGAVVIAALLEGEKLMHFNQGPEIIHTHSTILTSVSSLDKFYCASRDPGFDFRPFQIF